MRDLCSELTLLYFHDSSYYSFPYLEFFGVTDFTGTSLPSIQPTTVPQYEPAKPISHQHSLLLILFYYSLSVYTNVF